MSLHDDLQASFDVLRRRREEAEQEVQVAEQVVIDAEVQARLARNRWRNLDDALGHTAGAILAEARGDKEPS